MVVNQDSQTCKSSLLAEIISVGRIWWQANDRNRARSVISMYLSSILQILQTFRLCWQNNSRCWIYGSANIPCSNLSLNYWQIAYWRTQEIDQSWAIILLAIGGQLTVIGWFLTTICIIVEGALSWSPSARKCLGIPYPYQNS